MRWLTMILTVLLILAFVSMMWPVILGLLALIVITGVIGFFKMRKVARGMEQEWQQNESSGASWISEEPQQDSPFEQRVSRPEVFDAEYVERGTDDGQQSDTKGL